MTEADWQATTDVPTLLRWAVPRGTRRQLRLYLCGGCRANWHLLYHPTSREAIEVAEGRADGLVSDDDIFVARYGAEAVAFGYDFNEEWHQRNSGWRDDTIRWLIDYGALPANYRWGDEWRINEAVGSRLSSAAYLVEDAASESPSMAPDYYGYWWANSLNRVDWPGRWLVDCIYGNPFRPPAVRPEWRTPTVLAIAEGVYTARAYDRLPVLADALEDAGCDAAELLAHCRDGGTHARGCWVVDRVLDKPDEPVFQGRSV